MQLRAPLPIWRLGARTVRATVEAATFRQGIARIAAIDAPGALRGTVGHGSLELTRYDPAGDWWASTKVPIDLRRAGAATVVVAASALTSALVEATLQSPTGRLELAVRTEDELRIDAVAVPAEPSDVVPMPRGFARWELVEAGIPLPAVATDEGETTFRFARGHITMSNAGLRRMARRDVATAKVFAGEGSTFLAGAADEHATVMVFAPARIEYDRVLA